MKTIPLILGLTTAALGQTVWFHNALLVGTVNKETDPEEYWGEIRITNTGHRPKTATLTARRYNGRLFQSDSYKIA